jgi:hypothetical protein
MLLQICNTKKLSEHWVLTLEKELGNNAPFCRVVDMLGFSFLDRATKNLLQVNYKTLHINSYAKKYFD